MKRIVLAVLMLTGIAFGFRSRYEAAPAIVRAAENSNSIVISDNDDLAAKLTQLESAGNMGTLSATNKRCLMLMPGRYVLTDMLIMDTAYVDIVGLGAVPSDVIITIDPANSAFPLTITSGTSPDGVDITNNSGSVRVTSNLANAFSPILADATKCCASINNNASDAPYGIEYGAVITGIEATGDYIDLADAPYYAAYDDWYVMVQLRAVVEIQTPFASISNCRVESPSDNSVFCCVGINQPYISCSTYQYISGKGAQAHHITGTGIGTGFDSTVAGAAAYYDSGNEVYLTGGADADDVWHKVLTVSSPNITISGDVTSLYTNGEYVMYGKAPIGCGYTYQVVKTVTSSSFSSGVTTIVLSSTNDVGVGDYVRIAHNEGWYKVAYASTADDLYMYTIPAMYTDTGVRAYKGSFETTFRDLEFINNKYQQVGTTVYGFTHIHGTWINCNSYGRGWRLAPFMRLRANMINCLGYGRSFGGDSRAAVIDGTFSDCVCKIGEGGFGGCLTWGCNIGYNALFINCVAYQDNAYGVGSSVGGRFVNCIGNSNGIAGAGTAEDIAAGGVTADNASGVTVITKASGIFRSIYYGRTLHPSNALWPGRQIYITGTGVTSGYYEIASVNEAATIITLIDDIGDTTPANWAIYPSYGEFVGVAQNCTFTGGDSFGKCSAGGIRNATLIGCHNSSMYDAAGKITDVYKDDE